MLRKWFLIVLSLPLLVFAEKLDYIGSISCSGGATYSILQRLITVPSPNTLSGLYSNIVNKYLLLQTHIGHCSLQDKLTVDLKKPIEAFALLKFLTDIYNLQYIYEGDIKYKPTYVVFYRR